MSKEVKDAVAPAEPNQCTRLESIAPAIGVLGHDSMFTLWYSWITPFMTDILMLPLAFSGAVLAIARLFDAITDISMGVIADRTKSRFGRYRAWILRSGPLFSLCFALSFFMPGDNMTVKMVFAAIMYFLTGSIAFTSIDIPFWSLPAAMTSNTTERGKIVGILSTVSNAVSGIVGIVMPLMLAALGEFEWTSYFYIALGTAIFGVTMYLICFALVREHVVPDPAQKFDIKLALKNIYQNKPLLLLQLSNLACRMGMILKGGFNYFYFMYCIGNLPLMALMSLISIGAQVLGSVMFTVLAKPLGKKKVMIGGIVVLAAVNVLLYFVGWTNIPVFMICAAASSVCLGTVFVAINAMMMDTIEYGEWKTGQRNEALITSTRCFISKITTAIAGIAVMAALGLTGYAQGVAVQAPEVVTAIHTMYTLFCGGIIVLGVIPLLFYKLTEKRHAEIMAELKARKAAKGNQ